MSATPTDSFSRLTLIVITELPDEISLRRERLELLLDVLPPGHRAQHLNQADLLQREFPVTVAP